MPQTKLKFYDTAASYGLDGIIEESGMVIVAFSGGADSSCLLRLMKDFADSHGVKVCAAHVNHMIRGKEADRDEDFCRRVCRNLGIPIYVKRANVPEIAKETGKGIEEAARDVRYSFFDEVASSISDVPENVPVATAHNADDNLETVIFSILRGAGTHGLSGISPIRDGRYIRPLIRDNSDEIRKWCEENGVEYVVDSTNTDTDYTRNHIRHNIVPQMKKICPDPADAVARMTSCVRIDDDYLSAEAKKYADKKTSVNRGTAASMHPAILSRVLMMLYENTARGTSLAEVHITAMEKMLRSDTVEGELSLPGKIRFSVDRNNVSFSSTEVAETVEEPAVPFFYPDDGDVFENSLFRIEFSPGNHTASTEFDENIYNLSIYRTLCFDKIKGSLHIRYKADGDRYFFADANHKVKTLFNEKKFSSAERAIMPLLCDDDGIAYVPTFPLRAGLDCTEDGENALTVRFLMKKI